ncbi:MAG: hypothetical protein GF331_05440 [Chitinivibrionales bacterium]|nr:hypothetical protein [Chitinivibrionales bacterium]
MVDIWSHVRTPRPSRTRTASEAPMYTNWRQFLANQLPSDWTFEDRPPFDITTDGDADGEWRSLNRIVDGDSLHETLRSNGGLEVSALLRNIDDSRAFTLQLTVTNTSDQPRTVTSVKPLVLRWHTVAELVYVRTIGGGVNESVYPPNAFRTSTYRFDHGGFVWKEHGFDGRSSNDTVPVVIMTAGDQAIVAAMEWSGLWKLEASGRQDGALGIDATIMHCTPQLVPGESLQLPTVHCMLAENGLEGATNACRSYVKHELLPSLAGRPAVPPVGYNHWFDIGAAIDEKLMLELAERAAPLGVEYFVLDAGWYGGCNADELPAGRESFEIGVGNWETVDRAKFPHGLKPLADRVRALGMKFGIWFEFERAHRLSDWARQHPEWYIDIGAEYLHIDMRNADARQAILRVMDQAVRELDAEWIKLDYNIGPRPYWEHADPSGTIQLGYMQGLYETLARFREAHPHVLLECCASGGRRIDFGMLRHQHTAFLSDHTRFPETVRSMLFGAAHLLPGCACNHGINLGPGEQYPPLSPYALAGRMLGSPTLFGDIRHLSPDRTALIAGMVDTFKSYRHLLDQDCFPLLKQPTDDTEWLALQFAAYDRNEAVAFVFSGYEPASQTPEIRLKGLRADMSYRVSHLFSGETVHERIGGAVLMSAPLEVALSARSFAAFRVIGVSQ